MAIGAGIVFNVDMSELDDYVDSKITDKKSLFSKIKNYTREPNEINPFVKLDKAYQAENDKIKDIYLKNGRLSPEQLNAYINLLRPIHATILKSFDNYAESLRTEFAKSGTNSTEQMKLDRILAEKKQALKDQLEKKIQVLNNLPHNISNVLVINGKKIPIRRTDGNQIHVVNDLDSDEMLEYLAKQNQEKIQGNQVISIESYDSAVEIFNPLDPFSSGGGRYSFNRFDSHKVNDIFKITDVPPNGYKLTISRESPDGTPRNFYEQADKDRAYLMGVAQLAQRKQYRLNLQDFPKHLHDSALRVWVDNGRSYADVDGARKGTLPPTLFDIIVRNNISHGEVKAYCNMSKKDRELLNKQIQNQGEPLSFDDTLDSPLTVADRELLGQQISLNEAEKAKNKAKPTLQKLPSDSYDDATIDRIDKLYALHLEFEQKAGYRQRMYELNDIFKNTGLSDDKDLQIVVNQMPNSVYGQYINHARKHYADQNLINSRNQVEPAHNFDGPSSLDLLGSSNKDDFYQTNKRQPYIDQYRSNLADMSKLIKLLNSDKLPQDERIAMFKALEDVSANGSIDWSRQFDFLSQMPLGRDQQNGFLMAQYFMAMKPQHRGYAYNKLDPVRQNAIFPYLPESLQIIYNPDKAKALAQILAETYNPEGTKDRQAVLMEHMLNQTSPQAKLAFVNLQTSPLPSRIQVDLWLKDIIRDPKPANYQIGYALSYCLLNSKADPVLNKRIVKNILDCSPEKASYLIGQMDPKARIKLLEIIQNEIKSIQNPRAKKRAIHYYANKLVNILNETQSPNLIKELAKNVETSANNNLSPKEELLLAIVNHSKFDNKHAFENFAEGIAQNNNKPGLITQEMIYQQMPPTQETGRGTDIANRQNLVYSKLDDAIQKQIIDKELAKAEIAYKYHPKVGAIKELLNTKKQDVDLLKAKLNEIAAKETNPNYTAKQKCKEYHANCIKLYELAEVLKASDKDLDVAAMADDKRALPKHYNKLKEVKEKLVAQSDLPETEYNKAFQELQNLDLATEVETEFKTLEKNLPIANQPSLTYLENIKGRSYSNLTPVNFQRIETEAKNYINKHQQILQSPTHSVADKCKAYLENCKELYSMLEHITASDQSPDRKNISDQQRLFPSIYKQLEEINKQYRELVDEIRRVEKDSTLDDNNRTKRINELHDKLNELTVKLRNLKLETKVTESLEQLKKELIKSGFCFYMKKEAAIHLIKQIRAKADHLPYCPESKIFYAFNEKVQKQVFNELSPETQGALIAETSNLEKKSAWLKRLPAAQAKDLYLSQAERDLSLLKLLPASHQEEIATDSSDKKLSDTDYQIFTEGLANDGKIALLKKLHQKRAVTPELIDKYRLNPQPVKEDTSDDFKNRVANMLKGG